MREKKTLLRLRHCAPPVTKKARWLLPPGLFAEQMPKLPASIVVTGVRHVPVMVMKLATITGRIRASPMMIAMTLVVVAIPISYGDIAEVDGNCGAGGG